MILGAAASGTDIAVEISKSVNQVIFQYILTKTVGPWTKNAILRAMIYF